MPKRFVCENYTSVGVVVPFRRQCLRSLLFIPVILSIGAKVPKYFDDLFCYLFISTFLSCLQAIGVTADPNGKGVVLTTKKTKCKFFMYKTTVQVKQVKLSSSVAHCELKLWY